MKAKKLLLFLAPIALVLSCNPTGKKIIDLSKLNLDLTGETTQDKTLVMGKLSSSKNEDSEQMITVKTDNSAHATEFTFSENGVKDIVTSDVELTRFVKLNKDYAVISCIYNSVTYDRILDLSDGICYKFPDSSLLPNVKERFETHRKYREYFDQFAYLNDLVVQLVPQLEIPEEVFYYINEFDATLEDGTTKTVRRLCELRIDYDKKSFDVKAIITPEGNRSVQSFAVNEKGHIAYSTTSNARLTNTSSDDFKYHYYIDEYFPAYDINIESGYSLEPFLYTGRDGIIYCYLKKGEKEYYSGIIIIPEDEYEPEAQAISTEETSKLSKLPKKILNLFTKIVGEESTELLEKTFSIFEGKVEEAKNLISELFTLVMEIIHPKETRSPNIKWPWHRDDKYAPEEKSIPTLPLTNIIDGFSGYAFGYLFGLDKNGVKTLSRIECGDDGTTYSYVEDVLTNFIKDANEIETMISDGVSEDITVIINLEGENSNIVVTLVGDETEGEQVEDIVDATEVIDINDAF